MPALTRGSLSGRDEARRAGVAQASREETAECHAVVVRADYLAMGI